MSTYKNRRAMTDRIPAKLLMLSAALFSLLLWPLSQSVALNEEENPAPTQYSAEEALRHTVGPSQCGECHEAELQSWKSSAHQTSYKAMHKSAAGKAMAKKLELRRVKKSPDCVRCHYTQLEVRGKAKTKHGVSCESCHGPAKDWLEVHDDFGKDGATRESESKVHRRQRIVRSIKGGMNRPDQIYYLAKRCFSCHVLDDAKLFEVAEHPSGDAFELLSWSQGEVRHNFVRSKGKSNLEASPNRRRVIFGLGRLLEAEVTLSVLKDTAAGPFSNDLVKRLNRAIKRIAVMAQALPNVGELATLSQDLSTFDASKKELLGKLLTSAQKTARLFAKRTGEALGGLDGMMPKPDAYCGKAHK